MPTRLLNKLLFEMWVRDRGFTFGNWGVKSKRGVCLLTCLLGQSSFCALPIHCITFNCIARKGNCFFV